MQRVRNRKLVIILVLIILFILSRFSIFSPLRDGFRYAFAVPAQFLVGVGERIEGAAKVLFTVHDLAKENAELRAQLMQKESKLAELYYARGENEQLKKDLEFKQGRLDLQLLVADVLNYSPTGLYHAVTVNQGERDGVRVGQAVVSEGFLVGKVTRISKETAEVSLLSNRNLITPVALSDTQTVGLLKGSIRGLVVENIPIDTKVDKGMPVVTSSLEGVYPAGIAVGWVEEIISAREEIFLTLRVSTPVNPSDLVRVYIVKS